PIWWPSGGAATMAACPTTPLPPVRLTTFTGWPSSFSSSVPMIRAVASVPPPAAHGQISVIGRSGYAARPAVENSRAPSPTTARKIFDMVPPESAACKASEARVTGSVPSGGKRSLAAVSEPVKWSDQPTYSDATHECRSLGRAPSYLCPHVGRHCSDQPQQIGFEFWII